ncbi:hypothetical protein GCM10010485_28880 [Streptosporangium carneum]
MGVVAGTQKEANALPVNLGSAASFGVLAGSTVANVNLTDVAGDLGVGAGGTISGFPPGTVSGATHNGDAAATQALAAATAAYNDITARTPVTTVPTQLGGTTKTPGVYDTANGNLAIAGTLTLDAQSDPDALFIFKGATLSTASVSNVALIGGAQEDNVFWQLSDSATLGTLSTFRGNVLASDSVSVNNGAAVYGRLFALTDTVTLQGTASIPKTRITVPNNPPTTTALTTSGSPSAAGQQVTFTATVSPVTGSLSPQGQVAFKDGLTVIGTSTANGSGVATLTTSALSAGNHSIVAVYLGGDTPSGEGTVHFAPSASAPVIQIVTASLWTSVDTPDSASQNDSNATAVGVKFTASTDGVIRGIKFYKGSLNTGTHTGTLWTSGGQLLASAVFTSETASGWQQVSFSSPVSVTAGTTYVASYHTTSGFYSVSRLYFTQARTNGPLTAPENSAASVNGVYSYGTASTFPVNGFQATNYWVDVLFSPSTSFWSSADTPDTASHNDSNAITVGLKFRPSANGSIRGVKFYKGSLNTGTHTGSLWTSGGQLLAGVTFSNETASGWQEANFSSSVAVTAGTVYVVSYHTTSGFYSVNRPYFIVPRARGPLAAPENGTQGIGVNGVYSYGATNTFPVNGYRATNYWVDVLYDVG